MSNNPKRRSGAVYLGTVPAGTVMTTELIQRLIETQPRQPFDIEIKVIPDPPVVKGARIIGSTKWD